MDAEKDLCGAKWSGPTWPVEGDGEFRESDKKAFDAQSLDVAGHAVAFRAGNDSGQEQTSQD